MNSISHSINMFCLFFSTGLLLMNLMLNRPIKVALLCTVIIAVNTYINYLYLKNRAIK